MEDVVEPSPATASQPPSIVAPCVAASREARCPYSHTSEIECRFGENFGFWTVFAVDLRTRNCRGSEVWYLIK